MAAESKDATKVNEDKRDIKDEKTIIGSDKAGSLQKKEDEGGQVTFD